MNPDRRKSGPQFGWTWNGAWSPIILRFSVSLRLEILEDLGFLMRLGFEILSRRKIGKW